MKENTCNKLEELLEKQRQTLMQKL